MTTGREYSRGGGGGRIRKHRYKKIGGTMIKECRFMEDAHLSAAGSQASIPPTIDFHRVRRVSCPPFRAICFPGRHHWNYQRNDGNLVSCGSSILPFCFVANLYIYSCSREKSSFQGAMLIDDCKGKSLKLCFIVFQAISMMVHVSRKKMEYLVGILIFLFPFFFFSLVSF